MRLARTAFLALLVLAFAGGQRQQAAVTMGTTYVTRAELVTALLAARSTMLPDVENKGRYADIPAGSWYEDAMLAAAQFGIVSPNADGKLRPMASVSRAEFLKMLSLTFGITKEYPYLYTDIPDDAWYEPYAGIAQKFRLFDLKNPYALEPSLLMSETEAAKGLERFVSTAILQGQPAATQRETKLSKDAADKGLTLYSVISTRKSNAILDTVPAPGTQHVAQAPKEAPSVLLSLPELRTLIAEKVNKIRKDAGLKPLTYNVYLEGSAQQFAIDMAQQGFFSHVSPSGQTLKDRVGATGYYDRSFSRDCGCIKGYTFGENIARGQKTADEVMDAWMKSPSHRDAILNPDYNDIGVGAFGGLWVQHFGGVLLP